MENRIRVTKRFQTIENLYSEAVTFYKYTLGSGMDNHDKAINYLRLIMILDDLDHKINLISNWEQNSYLNYYSIQGSDLHWIIRKTILEMLKK